jgi:hypothetical protein
MFALLGLLLTHGYYQRSNLETIRLRLVSDEIGHAARSELYGQCFHFLEEMSLADVGFRSLRCPSVAWTKRTKPSGNELPNTAIFETGSFTVDLGLATNSLNSVKEFVAEYASQRYMRVDFKTKLDTPETSILTVTLIIENK